MSGDTKKKQKGFSKGKAVAVEAKKNGAIRGGGDGEPEKGAGICTKFVFFVLLLTFSALVTVNLVDYKAGQLKEAYLKHVPEEVRFKRLKHNFVLKNCHRACFFSYIIHIVRTRGVPVATKMSSRYWLTSPSPTSSSLNITPIDL